MPNNIDRRVVEMRFDNKDFEKNVGQTLISLETLQKALNMQEGQKGTEKVKKGLFGLSKAANSIDTSSVANNVSRISDRFSTLGIIGASVLQNIGTRIANLAFDLKNKLLAPLNVIKQGGLQRALNLEQANFQIKGLGIEKNDTASYYTEVMDAVLGTAYSYDVAAKAASQLAASNVGVIEKEKTLLNGTKTTAKYFNGEMTDAILGISGVAAMTGSSFEDISQVFTRVAGQGKVMANDLNSISSRGLNAAATLANYLGKTEAEVREMVTKGEIDFNTFSKAMTEAFGAHAKAATKTFSGALEDTKAALSRIGADFFGPYLTAARDTLNSITPLVDVVHDKIQPLLDLAGEGMAKYSKKLTGYLDVMSLSGSTISDGFRKVPPVMNIVRKGYDALITDEWHLKDTSVAVYSRLSGLMNMTGQEAIDMAKKGEVSFENWMKAVRGAAKGEGEYVTEIKNYLSDLSPVLARYENVADNLGLTQEVVSKGFKKFADVMGVNSYKVYEAVGEKLGMTGEAVKDAVAKGTFSLRDFRTALEDLLKDGAISADQFAEIMDFMDGMIIDMPRLSGAINRFGTLWGKSFNDILKAGKDIVLLFRDAFKGLINAIGGDGGESALFALVNTIVHLTAALARGISKLIEFGRASGAFKKLSDALIEINYIIFGFIDSLWYYSDDITKAFSDIGSTLGSIGSSIWSTLGKFFSLFDGKLSTVIGAVGKGLSYVFSVLSKGISQLDFSQIGGLLAGGGIFAAGLKLSDFFSNLTENFEKIKSGKGFIGNIREIFGELKDTIEEFQKSLKIKQLRDIAISIGILAGACLVLSAIPVSKLGTAVGAIGVLMLELTTASRFMKGANARGLIKMAAAILILSAAVRALSSIENIDQGLKAVGALLAELTVFFLAFSKLKIKPRSINKTATSMILFAVAIKLLVGPVKELGSMDVGQLKQGLTAIGGIMAGMMAFSAAMGLFKPKNMIKAGASMILIVAAIRLMIKPIQDLGTMNINIIKQGLLSIAAALAMMGIYAIAVTKLSSGAQLIAAGAALVIMATGVQIMAGAISTLSNIKDVGKGLSTMFGSLVILAGAMLIMQKAVVGAAAMVIVAGALMIMAPAIALLSSLSLSGVGVGLLALAGTLTVFGIAAALLTPVVPLMLALGAAMALLGVGVVALGAGMTLLAAAFVTGVSPIVQGVIALSEALPEVLKNLAEALGVFMETLATQIPKVLPVIEELFKIFIIVATEHIPEIVNIGIQLIMALLNAIRNNIEQMTVVALEIISNFLNGLAEGLPQVIDAGFNLIISFFDSMADAISTKGPELMSSIENMLLSIVEVFVGGIPFIGGAASDAIASYREGLQEGKSGIQNTSKSVATAAESSLKLKNMSSEGRKGSQTLSSGISSGKGLVRSQARSVASAADMKIPSQYSNGQNAVQGLASGMNSMLGSLRSTANAIASVVDTAVRKRNAIHSPSKVMIENGRYIMMGLIKGLDYLTPEYERKADNIATTMISSISGAKDSMSSFAMSDMDFNSQIMRSSDVNLRINDMQRENERLAHGISQLTSTLGNMTETMNSRSLNNYITVDGSADPEAFADGLIRSFKLNARTT